MFPIAGMPEIPCYLNAKALAFSFQRDVIGHFKTFVKIWYLPIKSLSD
jgi:hypothetical protein